MRVQIAGVSQPPVAPVQLWIVSCMNKSTVICGIEHALRDDGCNEIPVGQLYARVRKTRGNFDLTIQDFLTILKELERDKLFESVGEDPELSEDSLIARSQTHPSVPYGDAIQL